MQTANESDCGPPPSTSSGRSEPDLSLDLGRHDVPPFASNVARPACTVGVTDLERAVAFYRDGLGLPTRGIMGTEFEIGAVAFFELESGLTRVE
jgi:hypothetical protein